MFSEFFASFINFSCLTLLSCTRSVTNSTALGSALLDITPRTDLFNRLIDLSELFYALADNITAFQSLREDYFEEKWHDGCRVETWCRYLGFKDVAWSKGVSNRYATTEHFIETTLSIMGDTLSRLRTSDVGTFTCGMISRHADDSNAMLSAGTALQFHRYQIDVCHYQLHEIRQRTAAFIHMKFELDELAHGLKNAVYPNDPTNTRRHRSIWHMLYGGVPPKDARMQIMERVRPYYHELVHLLDQAANIDIQLLTNVDGAWRIVARQVGTLDQVEKLSIEEQEHIVKVLFGPGKDEEVEAGAVEDSGVAKHKEL